MERPPSPEPTFKTTTTSTWNLREVPCLSSEMVVAELKDELHNLCTESGLGPGLQAQLGRSVSESCVPREALSYYCLMDQLCRSASTSSLPLYSRFTGIDYNNTKKKRVVPNLSAHMPFQRSCFEPVDCYPEQMPCLITILKINPVRTLHSVSDSSSITSSVLDFEQPDRQEYVTVMKPSRTSPSVSDSSINTSSVFDFEFAI